MFESRLGRGFSPASHVLCMQPAGPNFASHTLLPSNLTSVYFGNLDGCFV